MGKLAHDNKAPGSVDTVNDAVVLRQFMLLSGEICLTCNADRLVSPGSDSRDTKSNSYSLLSTVRSQEQDSSQMVFIATGIIRWLIKQKSAEAIVAQRSG